MNRPDVLAPYQPYPWQIGAWRDKSRILVATGTAGGGKSRFAGEKIHGYLKKYPGSMGLIVRKTRQSMSNSTLLFMQAAVIGADSTVHHLKTDNRFEYGNGSVLAYGGMADEEQRQQIRSIGLDGGLDIIWMEEANLFKEADFNELLPRLRGKSAPWRQIIITTNPDAPTHWIKQRIIDAKLGAVYLSSYSDNAANPADYLETLNMVTGVQHERLVKGLWVQAEGVIYDNWSHDNIDGERAKYDPALPVIWAVDDGYKNPRVILLCQEHPNGDLVVFAEYYRREQLPEASINEALAFGYPVPMMVIYDPSAVQFAALLWDRGWQTIAANNDVAEGVKAVRSYLRDGNGVRCLFVHPDCTNLIQEIATYSWSTSPSTQGGDPKPIKENDHACDALRYLVATNHSMRTPKGGWQ